MNCKTLINKNHIPKYMKQILIIVAPTGFRDEELFEPKQVLENAGHQITIASKNTQKAKGALGGEIKVNLDIKDINTNNYDVIIFTGGPGTSVYFNDPEAHRIARETLQNNKILAAICIAPIILAKAGVLKNKKATVWDSNHQQASILKERGATYTGGDVTTDSNIITANGPQAAKKFGEAIAKALQPK